MSRLDTEFAFLAEQSTEQYPADAEAFADVQVANAAGREYKNLPAGNIRTLVC